MEKQKNPENASKPGEERKPPFFVERDSTACPLLDGKDTHGGGGGKKSQSSDRLGKFWVPRKAGLDPGSRTFNAPQKKETKGGEKKDGVKKLPRLL